MKTGIAPNSCILSSTLLDELDYVLTGQSKPTIEFLFDLNSFIEAYVLSSEIIMFVYEMDHINLTRKCLFPNGRPLFDMLAKFGGLFFINHFLKRTSKIVYIHGDSGSESNSLDNFSNDFCKQNGELIRKNLIISDIFRPIELVKTFGTGKIKASQAEFGNKAQLIVSETPNSTIEVVRTFFDEISTINIQAALPVFTYEAQLEQLKKKAISKEIYNAILTLQNQSIQQAEAFLKSELQIIPPFVSIVLAKARSLEDIPFVINELRADFTDFRSSCEKHERRLNESEKIKDQLDAIKEYKEFWTSLVRKYTDKNSRILYRFIDVAKDSEYISALDKAIDQESVGGVLKDMNMGKVAGKLSTLIYDKIKEKRIMNRFKGVSNLWSLLENVPVLQKQISDIERLFGTTIDRSKATAIKTHLQSIKAKFSSVLPNTKI